MEQRELSEGYDLAAGSTLRGQLVQKWKPLLEGLDMKKQQRVCENLAILFENESKHLQSLEEQTRAINVGPFTKFIFPILRRVFPNLIAQDIVSVQPMTAPIGLVFYYDMKYGTSKGRVTAGDTFVKDFNQNYSSEFIDGELIGTGNAALTAFNGTLSFTPIRTTAGPVSGAVLTVKAGSITGVADAAGVITGTGIAAASSVNYSTGAITVNFTVAPAALVQVLVEYEYNSEFNSNVPQGNIDISSVTITAVTRKLKALWSSEAADDLRSQHGLQAEAELVAGIAQELALEIDREILTDIKNNATATPAAFDRQVPAGITEHDHIRSLLTKISDVSNNIHKRSVRAPANWIVTSVEISSLIEQLQTHGDYRPNVFLGDEPGLPMPMGNFGIFKMGTLLNRWAVYRDPFYDSDEMLIGLKGQSFLDAGYVWAPYIPLQVTPTFLDPNDQAFKKGMRTRYGKQMLRPEFYGKLTVSNL